MKDSTDTIEAIVESQKEFIGEKQALSAARKSSLNIGPEGEIQGFYGQEQIAIEILLQKFYESTGQPGLNYTQRYLHKKELELPEGVQMPESGEGMIEKLRSSFQDFYSGLIG